jgi:hypothetical protein
MSLPPLSFIFLGWLIGVIFFYRSSSGHSRKNQTLQAYIYFLSGKDFYPGRTKNKCVLATAFLIL